ncbi:MAG: hypothetical protein ACHP85_25235, partial [Burkholderiales bacterium]
RDVMEPLDQLLAREFPSWDPYPNGAKLEARLLVRHILISEALLAEYGKAFEGLSEAQVVALAESFPFSRAKRRTRLEAIRSGKERSSP